MSKVASRYWMNTKNLEVIVARGVILDDGQFVINRGRTVIPIDKHHESAEQAIDSYIDVIESTLEKLKAQRDKLNSVG